MFNNTLLIDHNLDTLYFHRCFLDHYNFCENILEFQDANLALESLIADVPNKENLVFLDLDMPMMSAWKFVDRLLLVLSADQLEKTTIVLVSSSNNPQDIIRANQHPNIFTCIEKPFLTDDMELLIEKLEILLKSKQNKLKNTLSKV